MKHILGVTLVEIILVLVIGSVVLLMSAGLFKAFRQDADIQGLRNNIDLLMAGATRYYQANCGLTGNLAPSSTSSAVIVDIPTDLVTPGYLKSDFPPKNVLVDSAAAGSGYGVQFNKKTSTRTAYTDTAQTLTKTVGRIVFWTIQTSVTLLDSSKSEALKSALNATCTTTIKGDGTMEPCSTAASFQLTCQTLRNTSSTDPNYAANQTLATSNGCPTSGDSSGYGTVLVFERSPSLAGANPEANTAGGWMQRPLLLQFQQLYRNKLTLENNSGTQYFYCGG